MTQAGSHPQSAVEGRYLLDAALERWGVGEAWQCRDKNFRNRPVVVEFLPANLVDLAAERSQELRVQRALKHPCILPVINQGVHGGRPWVAFDGFDGAPLARFIDDERRTRGQVDRPTAQEVFDKVLDGVGAAHEAPAAVLHGCLSPRSVIVKPGALKVVDFALGPFASADVLGPFRAPELANPGESPSIASDVYALGVLLAELLLPQNIGDARKVLETFVVALTRDGGPHAGRMQRNDVPPSVWEVAARALRREPAARWDDVSSMRKALDAAWATAPLGPVAPVADAARAPAMRAPTLAGVARPQSPLGPLPPVAFSGTMPPLQPAFTPAPMPFVGAPNLPPPPVSPSAWDPVPPAGDGSDAWSTVKPMGQAQMKAALASAWDAPAPTPPGAPPVALSSNWNTGSSHPSWEPPQAFAPPSPGAGALGASDDDWEDETRASADHPLRPSAPMAIGPAAPSPSLQARLSDIQRQESTMALDIESLTAAGHSHAVTPPAPRPDVDDDDWKDSVVVVDTSHLQPSAQPFVDVDDDDDDVPEPGSRTRVAQPPSPVLDTMETLRPMQRMAALEPFVPRTSGVGTPYGESAFVAGSPPARPGTMAPMMPAGFAPPPVSERTMAIDTPGPSPVAQTLQAPMGMIPGARPPTPVPLRAPPPPSKVPIVVAILVALLLIGTAIAVVATRP